MRKMKKGSLPLIARSTSLTEFVLSSTTSVASVIDMCLKLTLTMYVAQGHDEKVLNHAAEGHAEKVISDDERSRWTLSSVRR